MMLFLIKTYLHRLVYVPAVPLRVLLLLAAILLYGTTGFLYFELPQNPDLSWSDGLWYSVVTMTTVGYGDFFPKSSLGRFFVGAPLMLLGIGLLGYTLSVVATVLITSKNKEIRGMKSFNFKDHLVVFNFAGITKTLSLLKELRNDPLFGKHTQVVLIDEELQEIPQELAEEGIHFVRGNPARDETLQRASMDKARYAVILTKKHGDASSDTLNVSITLAIEARSRRVNTVVECADPATEELLLKAGADHIICTARFDANFISQELLNPGLQAILDELLSNKSGQQIYLSAVSYSAAATFSDLARQCSAAGHLAIGIRRSERSLLNIAGNFRLEPDDLAITIGPERPSSFAVSHT